MTKSKEVILTGLRANNDLHLGNYLGALLPIVKMQKKYAGEYQINLFVPDLHSFTTPIDHSKLYEQTMHNLKLYLASGLDINNADTFIYRQSYIPAHSELTVILNNFAYMGELSRMTQYKEKKSEQENVSAGLFDYPVLMTADILLYGAKYVPVGDDQTQHVELARDIGIRFNNKFGQSIFKVPENESTQIAFTEEQQRPRIKDLLHPEKKMSKSTESSKGVIFLSDTPEEAVKKIMSATTDNAGKINYNHNSQPGISNLIDIYSLLSGAPVDEITNKYKSETVYSNFKSELAEMVRGFLSSFQKRLNEIDHNALDAKLIESEKAMNELADTCLYKVQKAVGLRS